MQAGFALGVVAANPPVRALARDPHCLGRVRHGHPLDAYPFDQQLATVECQPGVTVTHEDLRECEDGYLHCTRRSSPRQQPTRVTNVSAGYICTRPSGW